MVSTKGLAATLAWPSTTEGCALACTRSGSAVNSSWMPARTLHMCRLDNKSRACVLRLSWPSIAVGQAATGAQAPLLLRGACVGMVHKPLMHAHTVWFGPGSWQLLTDTQPDAGPSCTAVAGSSTAKRMVWLLSYQLLWQCCKHQLLYVAIIEVGQVCYVLICDLGVSQRLLR